MISYNVCTCMCMYILNLALHLLHSQQILVEGLGAMVATISDGAFGEISAVCGIHGGVFIRHHLHNVEPRLFDCRKDIVIHVSLPRCPLPVVTNTTLSSVGEPSNVASRIVM